MFARVGALAIYVTDLDRAVRFYTDVLGFKLSAQVAPDLCFLTSASGQIDIYLRAGHQPRGVGVDECRLSFFLVSQRPAADTFAALRSAGVKMLDEAPEFVGDGTFCFKFEDPDGNIIEVAGSE
jgi:catechol 2,3-dioxygenase-like lactoylglutathione lyase family enzyme